MDPQSALSLAAQAEVLTAAAAALAAAAQFPDEGWCQQVSARDKHGQSVDPVHGSAVRRCALGHLDLAVHRTGRRELKSAAFDALDARMPPPLTIAEWNDQPGRHPTQVRRVMRQAARDLQEKGQALQEAAESRQEQETRAARLSAELAAILNSPGPARNPARPAELREIRRSPAAPIPAEPRPTAAPRELLPAGR